MIFQSKVSRSALYLCLCMMLFLLPACSIARPAPDFETVSGDYMQRLRWRDLNGAARHYAEAYREDLRRHFGMADLNVVDVRLESLDLRPESGGAETHIVLEYYLLPSASVRQLQLRQRWELQGSDGVRAGVWRLVTPFPAIP